MIRLVTFELTQIRWEPLFLLNTEEKQRARYSIHAHLPTPVTFCLPFLSWIWAYLNSISELFQFKG